MGFTILGIEMLMIGAAATHGLITALPALLVIRVILFESVSESRAASSHSEARVGREAEHPAPLTNRSRRPSKTGVLDRNDSFLPA